MKHLFDYDKLLDFLRKNNALERGSVRVYYTDKHRKTASGLPEFQIRVSIELTGGNKRSSGGMYGGGMMGMGGSKSSGGVSQDFWAIGYEFKKIYTEGDSLFDGFLTEKEFIYLY